MPDQGALVGAFADYARAIARRYDIGEVLYQLTDHVMEVLGVDGAGVCIGNPEGKLRFVTATDERIVHIEERQITASQGPCHEAYVGRQRITCPDLKADERWPNYTPVALENGCRAVAGIPMSVDGERLGALNLYHFSARPWTPDDLEIAQLLADMATGYVINARTLTENERLADQLRHALESRVVIEQAKGVVAERHGIDPAAAFEAIRRHARGSNLKVHAVARGIVEGSLHV